MATRLQQISVQLDVAWLARELARARKLRPKGGPRGLGRRGLFGYADGVAMLVVPWFEVSNVMPGRGAGWFSFDAKRFEALVKTYSGLVPFAISARGLRVDRLDAALSAIGARVGRDDPDIAAQAIELRRREAVACIQALAVKTSLEEELRWHLAHEAGAGLIELVRAGSVILYSRPEEPDHTRRAVVDKKQVIAERVSLLCHDFKGAKVSVDPAWVTDLAL